MIRTTTTGSCRVGPNAEALRTQARCFLVCGIVFLLMGVALVVVSVTTTSFVTGPGIVVLIWGVICLFVSWRRFQIAKYWDNQTGNATVTITQNVPTNPIGMPPAVIYQHPPNNNGLSQGFTTMPPTQFTETTTSTTQFSSQCPPYASHGMYPTQTQQYPAAPPTYEDAIKPPV